MLSIVQHKFYNYYKLFDIFNSQYMIKNINNSILYVINILTTLYNTHYFIIDERSILVVPWKIFQSDISLPPILSINSQYFLKTSKKQRNKRRGNYFCIIPTEKSKIKQFKLKWYHRWFNNELTIILSITFFYSLLKVISF